MFVHPVVGQQQETVYLPELLHNITLLVEKTEHEIVTGDKKYAIVYYLLPQFLMGKLLMDSMYSVPFNSFQ